MTDARTVDEEHERRRLTETVRLLEAERDRRTSFIDDAAREIQAQKEHLWQNARDMDGVEKAGIRVATDVSITVGQHAVLARQHLERLLKTPYFGRVDFREDGESAPHGYYIGVHDFSVPQTQQIWIHDWRAPVSSLYYDFESGRAHFEAPTGVAKGEITRKRQYKIQGGHLEYMFDSSLTIGDEVLQRELSRSADDKMKNIVATIQREQNAVIRNESAPVLILQGVAGSGKTSIALHRVAFLLYRFKDSLSSSDVTILSPNKVFADYIADVLPELGEERIAEIDAGTIAAAFLAGVSDHQTFSEQVVGLLDGVDDATAARMRYKATPEFVTLLEEWISSRAQEFSPAEVMQRHRRLPADWIADVWATSASMPLLTRVDHVADTAAHRLRHDVLDRGSPWSASDTSGVRRQVKAMFPYKDALALYRAFYAEPSRRGLFAPLGRKKIEYADVFPLIYTMILTGQYETYGRVRHLVVDEMQDYSPVQYAVLRRLFPCRMTILGDAHQSVNPFSSSSLTTIHSIFPEADCLELCRSYRSTAEITQFTQNISRNDKLVPVERHGTPPAILACADRREQLAQIVGLVERHRRSEYRSLGIVCKTLAQAEQTYRALTDSGIEATLLDYDSRSFAGGTVITSAHIAKGLEFDVVIAPYADDITYATEMDRGMLYIACTRAMHELHLTHDGPVSPLLEFATEPEDSL
jgi:DNA helicase-2/ATP-dependent DNA helicase PcrA